LPPRNGWQRWQLRRVWSFTSIALVGRILSTPIACSTTRWRWVYRKERLFLAYFRDGEAISDHETLVRLAEESGLDGTKASEILASGLYDDDVRSDEADARALGITGVPFFLIDRHFGISGAQSPDSILDVLDQAWADTHSGLVLSTDSETKCDEESCSLPR
jgi:predicted DsbA family dithiol-disulfide isomerase